MKSVIQKIQEYLAASVTGKPMFPPGLSPRERNKINKQARIKRTEARQRRGSQYARDHKGEPGRNGGPKGI